jgi:serine/threonine-protein phosphatase 2A regulatory subunit B
VKQVSVMNLDTTQSSGNGSTSSPGTNSCRAPLPNGGCSEKLYCPSNNISFPPGGCASLRLPLVVVLNPLYPSSLVLSVDKSE